MKRKMTVKVVRRKLIGYCYKCGEDVAVDFCDRCQIYVQPSPHNRIKRK